MTGSERARLRELAQKQMEAYFSDKNQQRIAEWKPVSYTHLNSRIGNIWIPPILNSLFSISVKLLNRNAKRAKFARIRWRRQGFKPIRTNIPPQTLKKERLL